MRAKSFFALTVLCLGFIFLAHEPAQAQDTAGGVDKQAATDFANNLGHEALAILTDTSASTTDKRSKLENLFQQNVAIDWVGKFVLGRFWREASDAQKQHYLINYKAFLIKHYTSNLTEFTDVNFEVSKVTPQDNGGQDVTVRIKRPQAEDTIVDYILRKEEAGGFKIYDIVVEGVSMITTQRSEFSSVASQKGLDYLIAQLETRSKTEDAQGAGATSASPQNPGARSK